VVVVRAAAWWRRTAARDVVVSLRSLSLVDDAVDDVVRVAARDDDVPHALNMSATPPMTASSVVERDPCCPIALRVSIRCTSTSSAAHPSVLRFLHQIRAVHCSGLGRIFT